MKHLNSMTDPAVDDVDSDACTSVSNWIVLEATPKASSVPLPLPPCLRDGFQPRIRAPFQVSQMQTQNASDSTLPLQSSGTVPAPARQIRPQCVSNSDHVAAPIHAQQQISSLAAQFHRIHTDVFKWFASAWFSAPSTLKSHCRSLNLRWNSFTVCASGIHRIIWFSRDFFFTSAAMSCTASR